MGDIEKDAGKGAEIEGRENIKSKGSDDNLPSSEKVHNSLRNSEYIDDYVQYYNPVPFKPPDGGLRSWLICFCSFVINGVIFGITNCYGVLYIKIKESLEEQDVTDVSTKVSLVGSLSMGFMFFNSLFAGILVDKFGIMKTTVLGGVLASVGLIMSSFVLHSAELLYLSYGVLFGTGASFAYTPSLVILGHYFKKKLGVVNGIVTCGSSVASISMPYIIDGLISSVGLANTLRVLGIMAACIIVAGLSFKELYKNTEPKMNRAQYDKRSVKGCCRWACSPFINFDIWRNKKFVIWALAVPSALFGYFVFFVHIVEYVSLYFPDSDGKLLLLSAGITSGAGRLVFGKVADLPRVNRIVLQQISFASMGVIMICLSFARHFWMMIVLSLLMGVGDGCFISMFGPIAFDICGQSGASQALGFILAMCSIPLTVGPPIAGSIYTSTGSYFLPFCLAGVPFIVGSILMCFIHRTSSAPKSDLYHTETQATKLDLQEEDEKEYNIQTRKLIPANHNIHANYETIINQREYANDGENQITKREPSKPPEFKLGGDPDETTKM